VTQLLMKSLVMVDTIGVKPETVKSYELGYKGVIGKKLMIDGYVYYSRYQDFLVGVALVQSRTGANSDLYSPFSSTNLSYVQSTE